MKLWVEIQCDVDVPDAAVTGGATPEAIAQRVSEVCRERVERIFAGWGNSVTVRATTSGQPVEGSR